MSQNHQPIPTGKLQTEKQETENLQTEKPFVIELWEEDRQPGGHFTPAAALLLTASFRTSGLLGHLAPDDLKSLVYLLTFLSPEGHCQPYLSQLSEAMHTSLAKTKVRMRRLCDFRWKGEPLVIYSKSASGLSAYSLNPRVVDYRHRKQAERQPPPYAAAPREAVIAHSRNRCARPRAEVERIIAAQMGHEIEETAEQSKLRFRLENAGLTTGQATDVVLTYAPDVIAQQLDWLPYRGAKNPAGYLLAAIEGGYSEPRGVREERLFRELRYGELALEQQQVNRDEVGVRGDGAHETDATDAHEETSRGDQSNSELFASTVEQSIDLPLPEDNFPKQ